MKALINKIKITDNLFKKKIIELLNNELKYTKLVYVKYKKIVEYKQNNEEINYSNIHKDIKKKKIGKAPYKYLKKDELVNFYCLLDNNKKYDFNYEEIKLENIKEIELSIIINFLFETLVREELKKFKNEIEFQDNVYILINKKQFKKNHWKKDYLENDWLFDTLKIDISYRYSLNELIINLKRNCFMIQKKDETNVLNVSLDFINYSIINNNIKKLSATEYSEIAYMDYSIEEVKKTIVYCQNFIQDLFIKYFEKHNISYEKMYFENKDKKTIKINKIEDINEEILLVNNIQDREIREFELIELDIIKDSFKMIDIKYTLYKKGKVISNEDIFELSQMKNKKILFLSDNNINFLGKEISSEQANYILNNENENIYSKLDLYTQFKLKNLLYKQTNIVCQNILVLNNKQKTQFEKIFKNGNKLSDIFITSINELKIKNKLVNYNEQTPIFSFDFEVKEKTFSSIYIKSKHFNIFNVETLKDAKKSNIDEKIIKINFKIKTNKLYIINIEDLTNSDDFLFDYNFINISKKNDNNKLIDNQFYLIDEETKDYCYIDIIDKNLPIIIGNDKLDFIDCINKIEKGSIKINKRNEDSKLSLPKGKIIEYDNTYLLPFINTDKKTKELIHIENHENYSNYYINRDKNPSNNKVVTFDRIHKVMWCNSNNGELKNFQDKDIYNLFFNLFTSNVIKTKNNNSKTLLPEKLSKIYLDN